MAADEGAPAVFVGLDEYRFRSGPVRTDRVRAHAPYTFDQKPAVVLTALAGGLYVDLFPSAGSDVADEQLAGSAVK